MSPDRPDLTLTHKEPANYNIAPYKLATSLANEGNLLDILLGLSPALCCNIAVQYVPGGSFPTLEYACSTTHTTLYDSAGCGLALAPQDWGARLAEDLDPPTKAPQS